MAERSSPSRSPWLQGSSLGAGIALVAALLVIVNYFGWKYYERVDMTETRLYSLSDKTLNVLRDLDRDVEVIAFMDPGDELAEPTQEILTRYEAASPRISLRVVDPVKNLAEAQSLVETYEISRDNVVVLDTGDDRRVIEASDLAEYDYSGMQTGQGPTLTAFNGEQAFTSAIVELVESRKPRILFTSGHGEAKLDDFSPSGLSSARDLLGQDNFELEEWASLGRAAVPEGTDLVVVAGPTAGFTEPEVEALRTYLERGGRLLVLLDPTLGPGDTLVQTGLEGFLAEIGAEVGSDIVVDPDRGVPFYGAETFFVEEFGDHPITEALSQVGLPVIFPLARSVAAGEAAGGARVTELALSSSSGWGETNLADLGGVARDDDDRAGPVSLGVAIELEVAKPPEPASEEPASEEGLSEEPVSEEPVSEEASSEEPMSRDAVGGDAVGEEPAATPAAEAPSPAGFRVAVFGDSDFATNGQLANVGNGALLSNTLNWLVEREALVAIAAKRPEQVRLSLTQAELRTVTWLILLVLPGLAVAAGVAVYLRRRR